MLHYPTNYIRIPREYNVEINCYKANGDKVKCILMKEGKKWDKTVIDLIGSKGLIRNVMIKVPDRGSLKDNNIGEPNYIENLQKAASVEDIKEVLSEISYIQMQGVHNILEVYNTITIINELISALIKSLSHIDQRLIGKILRNNAASRWINPETFQMCPCIDESFDKMSNCYNDKIQIPTTIAQCVIWPISTKFKEI